MEQGLLAGEVARGMNSFPFKSHGWTGRPEHRAWINMVHRCTRESHKQWGYYGGRGITVSDIWRGNFLQFLADVGPRPNPTYSLDRIDNDGNYEPGNVRWATKKEQSNNRRTRAWKMICKHGHNLSETGFYLRSGRPNCTACHNARGKEGKARARLRAKTHA